MSLSRELARVCMRPVDDVARERALLHIIDWMGCAAMGAAQPMAEALWHGTGLPIAAGDTSGSMLDPWHALLFTGAIGNILEMDDIHRSALVHPGPVIIPAALFLARRLQCSGSDLLDAVVRGYEAMIRLGMSVGPGHYAYWHNTSTCGPLGATSAAASLLGLPESAWVDACGHAVTQAAGLWQVRLDPCMSKQWHNARAAQTGVQAALLARAGVSGAARIFEGEKGFFAAMCPDGEQDLLLNEPLAPWKIFDTSFKPWASCRHTHPAIDAAISLRQSLGLRIGSTSAAHVSHHIAGISVCTYADALAFCDQSTPATPAQARFSLQHAVAITLLRGEPTIPDFELAAISEPAARRLRDKVTLVCAEPWAGSYPQHFGAEVKITLTDGSTLSDSMENTRGDPERPMTDIAIIAKARALMGAAAWPTESIDDTLHRISALAQTAPITDLLALFQLPRGLTPPSIVIKAPVT